MEHETSQNLIKVELTVKQLTSILINFDYLNKLAKVEIKTISTETSPQKVFKSQDKTSVKEINVVKKQLDENVDSNSDSYIRYIFDLIRKCFKG